MRSVLTCAVAWLLAAAVGAAEAPAPPPKFTTKPTATRAGDKVKIDFAVGRSSWTRKGLFRV